MSDVPVKTRISQYWHPVAEGAEVGDGPMQVRLLGEPLVLFRNGDEIVAGKDLCVHRGAPLSMGAVENGCVRCPYHGWLYDS
ncbi:MAG: Rieske 2Fe-2S domain-containing protein, partial [Acidimicrobiia bacterium]